MPRERVCWRAGQPAGLLVYAVTNQRQELVRRRGFAGGRERTCCVTTGDHVVPVLCFKYTATLQAAETGAAPKLIRIETQAGHGAGKPTSKVIEERGDILAFIAQAMKLQVQQAAGPARSARRSASGSGMFPAGGQAPRDRGSGVGPGQNRYDPSW